MNATAKWNARFANMFIVASTICATLILLEFAARLSISHVASDAQFARYATYRELVDRASQTGVAKRKYSLHRYLGYFPTPGWANGRNRHNALGFRGGEIAWPKPAGEYRIVCLGGSTTYTSFQFDASESYPARLQDELRARGYENVAVINAGVEGWSSHESLVNLAMRVLPLEPDCVIVYHGINDIHSRIVWPPESYTDDNRGWKDPIIDDVYMPPWWEYSALIRVALVTAGLRPPQGAIENTINPRAGTSYELQFREQFMAATYPQDIFVAHPVTEMIATNTPAVFERNLRNIARLTKGDGAEIVLATFAYSPDFPNEVVVASPEYQTAYVEMNDIVRRVAETEDTRLFDFAAIFPPTKENFVDGRHVNAQGCALKAKLFADFIDRSEIVLRE